MAFTDLMMIMGMGFGAALASVGVVSGANWLSAQPLPPHLREQMYDFIRSTGADV